MAKPVLGDEANLLLLEMSFLMSEARLLLAEDDIGNHEETHDAQSILSTLDYRLVLPAVIVLMIAKLQCVRYVNNRESIPRSSATLDLLLNYYHDHNPKIFRKKLRVYPETFDALGFETPTPVPNTSLVMAPFSFNNAASRFLNAFL
ncbi:hypothetical protein LIPSTDRAFT_70075 [Lipomyces starkeyi NRRL Y-11557]|uniref:Uncharacterized protein n=1 Tax=Lipomyces starkeyi NRRL Y-11557 TaxID=675824 RepID=A0A1E3QA39_LIPST|nr:hypothetical protein LIPSTDRAFT_70075 [Lipomyces starkeyi NRRL Y-11557]